ncbi:Alkaline phosphatase synthesis sensor protein PhoR [Pelotomaculum schinkii]|uniref:histidine kinase n=1 Tax=Pelotomaculum schinkii TaxID=78350 RepID=A0A4Y7RG54_9FIRM|nr:histidine kinase dimerization/phospho-acceptor domain-containing protein [Pelotomaculum schinkii]TEB07672.1 Alkaline phosphatase synthesis sensor protein PhoR [Pelotomaculum schinkii]
MDTKLRKSKPFTAWLCCFLAVSIITGLFITGLSALAQFNGSVDALKAPFTDYKRSIAFKERTGNYFRELFYLVAYPSTDPHRKEGTIKYLDNEGENLIYYAVNKDSGLLVKNIEGDLPQISGAEMMPDLPAGYKYYWHFDGKKVWVIEDGQPVDVERLDSGYRNIIPGEYTDKTAELVNSEVFMAVKDTLVKNPYGHSQYFMEQQFMRVLGWTYIALLVLGISLLIYAIIKRREKREFDRKLASWSGKIWLEVKIVLSLLVLGLAVAVGFSPNYSGGYSFAFEWVCGIVLVSGFTLIGLWWFYLMLVDLIFNGKSFFTHNSINSLLTWYRKYESRYSWQKSMLNRAYLLVAVEAVMALMSVMFLLAAINGSGELALLAALLIAGAGIYLIYRYLKRYDETLSDLGKLMDHVELVKNGDMKTRLEVPADSNVYPAAQNLNSIQEGIGIAVAEKIKSERMKIDLITNVSHDLKTPLTSIISYVELLNREEGLPEQASDYVKILSQKSERLKNIIQDLFDLSKANSENITLDMEQLDLARLIKQTLADMEESINGSGLTFRLNIPDGPVYIVSDGKKLYRVWENLITNALKYSLSGTRVYIDLTADGESAWAAIKNTANYEMSFSADEILQRFARGDASRTSEGSGLGLPIAQSFTQICGGRFNIKIDGDLFKVELCFKQLDIT